MGRKRNKKNNGGGRTPRSGRSHQRGQIAVASMSTTLATAGTTIEDEETTPHAPGTPGASRFRGVDLEPQPVAVVRAGVASERGPRPKNDDSYARSRGDDFFALSDGIGGAPHGDVISRIACNEAVRSHDMGYGLHQAFRRAAEYAYQVAEDIGDGDGATLLLADCQDATLRVASAGDTRVFLYRDGSLSSVGPEGRVDASLGLPANALDKAVGASCPSVTPDTFTVELQKDDWVVLCSDGVWESLGTAGMALVVDRDRTDGNPFKTAEDLCRTAVDDYDGTDNATCWCIVVDDVLYPDDGSPDAESAENEGQTGTLSGMGDTYGEL